MLATKLFNDKTVLTEFRADVWRVVESQEHAATLEIVDDLAEQELLEQLLDDVKPRYRTGTEGMHYLLKTAFRYPPLKWGSRFGTQVMPSYFYGSEEPQTALSECAYYRFLFLDDMSEPYSYPIRSEYALFKSLAASSSCLDLTSSVFDKSRQQFESPQNYDYSQAIGKWAYDRGDVEIIRFNSARRKDGINLAIASPKAIRSKKPTAQQRWLCLTKADSVSFSSRDVGLSYVFNLRDFCDPKGRLYRVKAI